MVAAYLHVGLLSEVLVLDSGELVLVVAPSSSVVGVCAQSVKLEITFRHPGPVQSWLERQEVLQSRIARVPTVRDQDQASGWSRLPPETYMASSALVAISC